MKIFIGSSQKAKKYAQRIIDTIKEIGVNNDEEFELLPWYNAFVATSYTLETLKNKRAEVDAAIFVFSTDDEYANNQKNIE